MKVFLGGTVNESKWRDEIIPRLKIDYFNPVVSEWTDDAIQDEERAKLDCDYQLFVITPKMCGYYSLVEAVDASNKMPERTVVCVLDDDEGERWSSHQLKSLGQSLRLVEANGAVVLDSLDEVVEFLNSKS